MKVINKSRTEKGTMVWTIEYQQRTIIKYDILGIAITRNKTQYHLLYACTELEMKRKYEIFKSSQKVEERMVSIKDKKLGV